MRKIRESGKEGEKHFEIDNSLSEYKRTGHGSDYEKTVYDSAGRKRKEPHEIKRNNSRLSKLQKKTRGLKVDRYVDTGYGVSKKTEDRFGNELEQDPLTRKWKKMKKRNNNYVLGNVFGSSSTKKRRKKSNDYGFNVDNIFGSGSRKKRRKSGDLGFGF